MHQSAMIRMKWFVDNYVPKDKRVKILDLGSYNVNGCYRTLFDGYNVDYIGADIANGPNVGIVLSDPYQWLEIEDCSLDFVISGNALEHIEFPWSTMDQIYKKLKHNGIVCMLAPFNLSEHRYPTDCYRYYPDGLKALAKWAGLVTIDATTGGYPSNENANWAGSVNYDDSVLIAIKASSDTDISKYPKLGKELRSDRIYRG